MNSVHCPEHDKISAVLPVRESVALLILVLMVFGCYANTLTNPFIFDDIPNILENDHLRLSKIDAGSLAEAAFKSPSHRRPLANLSFAFNYYLDGFNPRGYHLVNILIHILTGLLLYLVIKTAIIAALNRLPTGIPLSPHATGNNWPINDSTKTAVLPFMAAVLWAVHPIQTQSVTYLVQRMNAMAAMFFLLACLFFIKAEMAKKAYMRLSLSAGCILTGLMALASKEIAATLPFCLLLYRWFFTLDLQWRLIKRELMATVLVLVIFLTLTYFFLGAQPIQAVLQGYSARPFSLSQRVLTEFRVVIFYISLMIIPHPSRLNLDHHFTISRSSIDPPTTAFAIFAVIGLILMALFLMKKHRVISFCILWYLGNLVIESSVIGLELIFEHRNYLPSMSLALLLAWLLCTKLRSGPTLALIFISLVMLLSFWTYQRNTVWWDDLTLWQDCAEKSPQKARPVNKLGAALEKRDRLEEALYHYRQANLADPSYPLPYFNIGNVLVKQGKNEEAIEAYSRALHLYPGLNKARNNLALALARQGRVAEGIEQLEKAIAISPNDTGILINLGSFQLRTGNFVEAADNLQKALEKDPLNVELHHHTGKALAALGRVNTAVRHYRSALKIDPSNAMVHNDLAIALFTKGDVETAVEVFKIALKLKPDDETIRYNLERALKINATSPPERAAESVASDSGQKLRD